MQKTVVFGKKPSDQQNLSPSAEGKVKCKNCQRLLAQLNDLSHFSYTHTQITVQNTSENENQKCMRTELLDLREKYIEMKKKLAIFEKANNDLYDDNGKMARQLKACQIELKELLKRKKEPLLLESDGEYVESQEETVKAEEQTGGNSRFNNERTIEEMEAKFQKERKETQVQIVFWREKTLKLEVRIKDQCDQVQRLKELLRRRNKIQEQRHKIIQTLCF